MENDFSVLQMLSYALIGGFVGAVICLALYFHSQRKNRPHIVTAAPAEQPIATVAITNRTRQSPRNMRVGDTVYFRDRFLPANTPVVIAEIEPYGEFVVHRCENGNRVEQFQISPDAVTYELATTVTT